MKKLMDSDSVANVKSIMMHFGMRVKRWTYLQGGTRGKINLGTNKNISGLPNSSTFE